MTSPPAPHILTQLPEAPLAPAPSRARRERAIITSTPDRVVAIFTAAGAVFAAAVVALVLS